MRPPFARLSLLPLEDRLTPAAPAITAPLSPQKPTLVSIRPDGIEANNVSGTPAVTPDGRYVAFSSLATNLVPGDPNPIGGLFRRDMATGQVVRVDVTAGGTLANGWVQHGISISADGRYIAFSTWANNLAAEDTGGNLFNDTDIYRKDLLTGEIRLVSTSAAGTVGDQDSDYPQISADGRYVVFESKSTNLVSGDTNGVTDIFLKDLTTGDVQRVNTSTFDGQANGWAYAAALSANGRYVTFGSSANNLVPGDTNQTGDVFRKDLLTWELIRVNVTAAGGQDNGGAGDTAISADGRYVAFDSTGTNFVAGDTNGVADIYRKDLLTGQVVRVSVTAGGVQGKYISQEPTISADGRYVAFWSESPDLTAGGLYGLIDVYRKDLLTGRVDRVSAKSDGTQGDGQAFRPTMTADGQSVAFESSSHFLVPEDTTGGGADVYLWGPVGAAAVAAAENTTAVTTVTAADPDAGTTLTFSIGGGADAARFAIDPSTGVLTFVAAPDFEAPTDANADNTYEVTVRVSDGALTDDQAIWVYVRPVPTLPFADAFNPTPTGELTAYWTPRSGAFSVASGAAAGTATGANVAVVRNLTAADVAVSATVKHQVGGSLLATGLAARYRGVTGSGTGDANMYWGALNVFGAAPYTQYSAQIWKNVNGVWTNLTFNAIPINPSGAVGKVLRFEVFGSSLKLYLNDTLLCFAVDASLAAPGGVGLRTAKGSVLDDFAANVFAPSTPTLPFHDAFAPTPPRNTLPADWQERSGYFSVAAGRAVGGSVAQPNVATLNGVNVANVTVAADIAFTAANQTGQLVGRYTGAGDRNYYAAAITPLANGDALVRLLRNVNGAVTELGRKTLAGFFAGGFATPVTGFRFQLLGNQLSVQIGGITHLTATDGTFAVGSVGIRTSKGVGVDEFAAN